MRKTFGYFSLNENARVDLVLDNAGLELFTDLCLGDQLISTGCARKVIFHGKVSVHFVVRTQIRARAILGISVVCVR